jgi:hypothetical protein
MSDIPADYCDQLDLRGIIAQIDRDRAETRKLQGETEKFVSEQHKLIAEAAQLNVEQYKLTAEAAKLNRDLWLAPWVLAASLSSGVLVAVISHFWR